MGRRCTASAAVCSRVLLWRKFRQFSVGYLRTRGPCWITSRPPGTALALLVAGEARAGAERRRLCGTCRERFRRSREMCRLRH